MKPLSKQVASRLMKDSRLILERHDDSTPEPVTILARYDGTIYATFHSSTRISLPLSEYGTQWRFWSTLPDGAARALTPWRGAPSRLIRNDEISAMPRYESYTLEFRDPRKGQITAMKAIVEMIYNDSLLIATYNQEGRAIRNRWNRDVYGQWWRVWIGRPTEEQREGTPWIP